MYQDERAENKKQENQEESSPEPLTDDASLPPPLTIIDVYVMAHSVEEVQAVESTLDGGAADPPQASGPAAFMPEPSGSRRRHLTHRHPLLVLCLLCLLAGGFAGIGYGLFPLLTPATATITLVPAVKTVTATTILAVTPNPQDNNPNELHGRLLPSLSLTETGTVATTGTGRQEATRATGLITFYNALPVTQTIPAGELLTGADGAQVVTDQTAILPPAQLPTDGVATVSAHTLATGAASDIPARDIDAPCCRAYVLATNLTPFTGGQDTKVFPMVTQGDLDNETAQLRTSLSQSATAALTAQLRPGEALVQPVSCAWAVRSDHQPGDEAVELTVTLTESCQGEAYQQSELAQRVSQALTSAAQRQLGRGYRLTGAMQTTILHLQLKNGISTLVIQGVGAWEYQITQARCRALAARIAGKSRQQALLTLTQAQGIEAASIALPGNGTSSLPADPARIAFIVVNGTA